MDCIVQTTKFSASMKMIFISALQIIALNKEATEPLKYGQHK
jgi:hypothetical protein